MAIIFDNWLTEVGVLVLTILGVVYAVFRYQYGHWRRKGIFFVKPTFPLGNIWQSALFKKHSAEEFKEIYDQSWGHKVCGFFMLNKPTLLIRDPELICNILIKDFNYLDDRGFHSDEKNDHLSGNLFLMGGTKWRSLRTKLNPTFTSAKIKAMFHILMDNSEVLTEVLTEPAKSGKVIELRDVIARYSTDVIASAAFGLEINSLKNPEEEFRQWGRRFMTPSFRSFIVLNLSFMAPKLRAWIKIPLVEQDISDYFTKIVADTVEYREKNNVTKNDLMNLMIQLKNHGYVEGEKQQKVTADGTQTANKKLTVKQIAAVSFNFYLGGFETSSTTVSFALYEMAKNQDIQNRLMDELDGMLRETGGKVTYDAVTNLEYLDMVVKETLRKYPPLPTLNRQVTRDYRLPGHDCVLEKGTAVMVSLLSLHMDPEYFPNPELFDPGRFSEEYQKSRHPMVFLPFGDGPRICIGARFGVLQTKAALAVLISRFVFECCEKTPKTIVIDPRNLVITPTSGIHLKITNRKS